MGSSLSVQSAVKTISEWRSRPSDDLIINSGRREIGEDMQAIDRLQQSANTEEFNGLISTAMARLRGEFVAVLSRQIDCQAVPSSTTGWSSVTDSTGNIIKYEDCWDSERPMDDVIIYLRNIAQRMNSGGELRECIKVYKSVRKSVLESQLKRLRFEELRIVNNDIKKYKPDELKLKVEIWIQVSKICVNILFKREKQLCEQILEGLGDGAAKDECFMGTVEDFAVGLFGFAKGVSLSKQSYIRLETILDLYDAFLLVLPDANALFCSEQGKVVRKTCVETLSGVKDDVGRMLYDLEHAVIHASSDVSDDRGAIDQLTEYVMKQISIIVRNKKLLTNLIESAPSLSFGDFIIPQEALANFPGRGFLELHLILIVEVLLMNLEKKSQRYSDSTLGQLFMMNNVCYIVRSIEGSNELQEMIGDHYIKKLNENLKFAMASFQESTCSKFLTCFEDKGLYINRCFRPRVSRSALKKRLKSFNSVFEEIQSLHFIWTIPDSQLKNEVCFSLSEKLVPAYKNFLETFRSNPETSLILEQNIKYSAEGLEDLVLEKSFAHSEDIV